MLSIDGINWLKWQSREVVLNAPDRFVGSRQSLMEQSVYAVFT